MGILNRPKAPGWPLLVAVLVFYWSLGFYPYQLPPYYNGVTRTADQGLRFDSPGIAYTPEPPAWVATAIGSSSLRVTLEVRAAPAHERRWARILTLSRDSHNSNLSIAQDGRDLIVQLRGPETNHRGRARYVIEDVFAQPGWHRIELEVLPRLLTVTADDREVLRQPLALAPLSNWSPEYRLALGNALGFNRPWLGEVRKAIVLVASEPYDYLLPEMLATPASYGLPLANRYVKWIPFSDYSDDTSAVIEKMVNLFGFIPFGMILAMTLRRRRSVWTLAALCCGLSLSIEAGQLFLAPRTPSADDLLLNTLGGTLGAWLGLRLRGRCGRHG